MEGVKELEHLVFMYGTLKMKQPNHPHMYDADPQGVQFIGHAITDDRYPLIIITDNNLPFLIFHDGSAGNRIIGEVYKVNDVTMEHLDKFEAYPRIYDRRLVDVTVKQKSDDSESDNSAQSHSLKCWIYGLSRFKPSLLDQPMYNEYLSDGDHNKPFIPIAADAKLEDVEPILFEDKQ